MPNDPAALLPLAEACGRAQVEDELRLLRRIIPTLVQAGLLSWTDGNDAENICLHVANGVLPRSCLLGAAMMLKPAEYRCGFEEADGLDADQRAEAWCWPDDRSWEPDWREGNEGYRGHPHGSRSAAVTPALAMTGAFLRAHHTAAADDGGK